jgi:predicted DNA-binding transcriptional regulator YafY
MAGRFHLDPAGWYQGETGGERLPELAQAVWGQRGILVRYERWSGPVVRTLEPLGLILKGGVWYLAARPAGEAKAGARTYRVSNILTLEVGEDGFERPADFDLASWWAAASARFETELFTGEARLRLTAEGLRRLRRLGSAYAALVAATETPAADAWVEVIVPIESIAHAAIDFLRLGPEAEVVGPLELRAAMAETVGRMAALYGD